MDPRMQGPNMPVVGYDPNMPQTDYSQAINQFLQSQGAGAFGQGITHDRRLDELGMGQKARSVMDLQGGGGGGQMSHMELMERLRPYLAAGGQPPQPPMEIAQPPMPGPEMVPPQPPMGADPGQQGGIMDALAQRRAMMAALQGE